MQLPGGPHIVESIQLFAVSERVKNLLLAPRKVGQMGSPRPPNSHATPAPEAGGRLSPAPLLPQGTLFVGYSRGVLQIPLANCSLHRSCAECVLARDPYCAWHRLGGSCQPAHLAAQDV